MRAWRVTYRYNERTENYRAKVLIVVTRGEDPFAVREAIEDYEESKPGGAPSNMRIVLDRLERLEPEALVTA
jgi:hypothetical protein